MRTDVVLVKLGAALIVVTAVGNFQTYLSMIIGKPWWVPTALIALLFALRSEPLLLILIWLGRQQPGRMWVLQQPGLMWL